MGRFTTKCGFTTLGVGIAFDVLGTENQNITKQDTSREFDIKAGVRRACVLSPRLFSCVLEMALKKQWQDGGLEFGDGGIPLLDLRFVDDIFLFAISSGEAARMVDAVATCLREVGSALNASKTGIPTKQAQLKTLWKWKCLCALVASVLVVNIERWQQRK